MENSVLPTPYLDMPGFKLTQKDQLSTIDRSVLAGSM